MAAKKRKLKGKDSDEKRALSRIRKIREAVNNVYMSDSCDSHTSQQILSVLLGSSADTRPFSDLKSESENVAYKLEKEGDLSHSCVITAESSLQGDVFSGVAAGEGALPGIFEEMSDLETSHHHIEGAGDEVKNMVMDNESKSCAGRGNVHCVSFSDPFERSYTNEEKTTLHFTTSDLQQEMTMIRDRASHDIATVSFDESLRRNLSGHRRATQRDGGGGGCELAVEQQGMLPKIAGCESTLCDSVCVTEIEGYTLRAATPEELEKILGLRVIRFADMPKGPKKIAEASFSEVFMVAGLVYKIAPLNEYYSREAFCREAAITRFIDSENGVCKLADAFIVSGRYSEEYIKAWEQFPNPENSHPSSFSDSSTFGCIVMEHCGADLESYRFEHANDVVRFLHSLVRSIAALEKKYKFEHRDLHWGNVMVSGEGQSKLIDFSISRMEVPLSVVMGEGKCSREKPHDDDDDRKTKESGEVHIVIYTDLNEMDWLFNGDQKVDVQFGVYKRMKGAAKNGWMEFIPETNRQWLSYIIKKLMVKVEGTVAGQGRKKVLASLKKCLNVLGRKREVQIFGEWLAENVRDLLYESNVK